MLLNFMGLKNLKKTLDFAKSILGETGEVEVEERYEPVVHAEKEAEEASVVAAQVIAAEEEVSDTGSEETQEEVLAAEKEADEAPKKRKSKKSQDVSTEESE
jgi:hypothetical protein